MAKISVIINAEGDVEIDTSGFVGTDCEKVHRALAAKLGTTVEKKDKPSKYQKVVKSQKIGN
jgi:hypothetical protein